MDHRRAVCPKGRGKRIDAGNNAVQRGDVGITDCREPAVGVEKIVLHIDDDQRRPRQIDGHRLRFGGEADRARLYGLTHQADPGRVPRPPVFPFLSLSVFVHVALLSEASVDPLLRSCLVLNFLDRVAQNATRDTVNAHEASRHLPHD